MVFATVDFFYQHYYNWDRIHGSLGKTPVDRVVELSRQIPFWDEVEDGYDTTKEFIRDMIIPKMLNC